MSATLLLAQLLNGLQYGVLLFLLAAGLTLVFGIMSFVNLAHGSLYMMGAYAAAVSYGATGSFALAPLAEDHRAMTLLGDANVGFAGLVDLDLPRVHLG